jgi:hypothetical protein
VHKPLRINSEVSIGEELFGIEALAHAKRILQGSDTDDEAILKAVDRAREARSINLNPAVGGLC